MVLWNVLHFITAGGKEKSAGKMIHIWIMVNIWITNQQQGNLQCERVEQLVAGINRYSSVLYDSVYIITLPCAQMMLSVTDLLSVYVSQFLEMY